MILFNCSLVVPFPLSPLVSLCFLSFFFPSYFFFFPLQLQRIFASLYTDASSFALLPVEFNNLSLINYFSTYCEKYFSCLFNPLTTVVSVAVLVAEGGIDKY